MRSFFSLCLLMGALFASPSFAATGGTVRATINGLVCDFCAQALDKVFRKQAAVEDIAVDLTSKIVTITLKDGQALDDAVVTQLITDAGYDVTGITRSASAPQ